MKNRLKIDEISVKSFITILPEKDEKAIKGGAEVFTKTVLRSKTVTKNL